MGGVKAMPTTTPDIGRLPSFDEIVGCSSLKERAIRDIIASEEAGEVLPHIGLFGPGGLGKTTFAEAVAEKLKAFFFELEASAFKDVKGIKAKLQWFSETIQALRKPGVFFVDEAHRLGALQEVFYNPLQRFLLTTDVGVVRLAPFTCIVATTHPHMLTVSFRTRLPNKWYMHSYSIDEMRLMVYQMLKKKGMRFNFEVVKRIAARCLGNPRIASGLVGLVRNTALAERRRTVTVADCDKAFQLEGIDELGLTPLHVQYLTTLFNAGGIPKGVSAIAGKLGQDEDVISGFIEPQLLELQLIDTTSRGRILTTAGQAHLLGSNAV